MTALRFILRFSVVPGGVAEGHVRHILRAPLHHGTRSSPTC